MTAQPAIFLAPNHTIFLSTKSGKPSCTSTRWETSLEARFAKMLYLQTILFLPIFKKRSQLSGHSVLTTLVSLKVSMALHLLVCLVLVQRPRLRPRLELFLQLWTLQLAYTPNMEVMTSPSITCPQATPSIPMRIRQQHVQMLQIGAL